MDHSQYLIAVTLQQNRSPGSTQRDIYRVPKDARLSEVVHVAKLRSEMPGPVSCNGIEILGTLEPHLFDQYVDLLNPVDVTDMA